MTRHLAANAATTASLGRDNTVVLRREILPLIANSPDIGNLLYSDHVALPLEESGFPKMLYRFGVSKACLLYV
jgi:hypothetical protein